MNVKKIIFSLLFIIILFNIVLNLINSINQHIDFDEWQHLHITWNVYNGQIIYKDFFEHHGAVYPLINSILFSIFNLGPEFETAYFFRFINIIFSLSILFVTYKIAKEVTGSFFIGLFSTAILSTLFIFEKATTQIRPDAIQNLFWLISILFFVKYFNSNKKSYTFFVGIFTALSMLANPKAIIGPGSIILYLVIQYFIDSEKRKEIVAIFGLFLLGNLTSYLVFSIYFIVNNALEEFLFYNYVFNVVAALKYHLRHVRQYVEYYLIYESLFLLLSLSSIIYFVIYLGKEKINWLNNKKIMFLLIISTATSFIVVLGLYANIYLVFLPLISILIAYAIADYYNKIISFKGRKIILIAVSVLLLGQLLTAKITFAQFGHDTRKNEQKELLNYVLSNSERNDPMLFIWDNAGGYVFNADLQYFWCENENFKYYYEKLVGYDVFGRNLIKKLEENKVKFLIGSEGRMDLILSEEAMDYVRENYTLSEKFQSFWIRK